MGCALGAEGRAVLSHLVLFWALVVPGIQQEIRLSQRPVMVGYAGGALTMPCHVSRSVDYVHWFRQLEGQAPERLLYLALSKRNVQRDSVLGSDKVSAARSGDGKSCTMSLMKLAKSDEGLYYCAAWASAQQRTQPWATPMPDSTESEFFELVTMWPIRRTSSSPMSLQRY